MITSAFKPVIALPECYLKPPEVAFTSPADYHPWLDTSTLTGNRWHEGSQGHGAQRLDGPESMLAKAGGGVLRKNFD